MAACAFGVSLGGCATVDRWTTGEREMALQMSEAIPAARGEVEWERKDQGQTEIEVEVEHLAPPGEAVPGATVYVVWLRPLDEPRQVIKLGILNVEDDRDAELEATAAFDAFELFVTAEPVADVAEPSGQQLMTASTGPV